jgi:predicted RNase H-like HicB family nuclease
MDNNLKFKLELTGILVRDENDHGYTAFFAELPEAVAEGDTELEAQQNLFEALKSILAVKKSESFHDLSDQHNPNYIEKSFELEIA